KERLCLSPYCCFAYSIILLLASIPCTFFAMLAKCAVILPVPQPISRTFLLSKEREDSCKNCNAALSCTKFPCAYAWASHSRGSLMVICFSSMPCARENMQSVESIYTFFIERPFFLKTFFNLYPLFCVHGIQLFV